MTKRPFPLLVAQRPQQSDPARMQVLEQLQGNFYRHRPRVRKFRPLILAIRLNGRLIFGERQPKARVAVQMTVGYVMDHLPDRPATRPVRRVELRIAEPSNSSA